MADEGTPKGYIPPRTIQFFDWIWKWRPIILAIIGVILAPSGIFQTWLFTDPSSYSKAPVNWFYESRITIGIVLAILVVLFLTSAIVRLIPASKSEYALKRLYLDKLIGDQMGLTLSGIPQRLVEGSGILLEEIFIPLLFHRVPSTNIQPLDKDELAEISQRRHKGLQVDLMTRLINEAAKEQKARGDQKIAITEVWQGLTRHGPAAVIQGYPGIGKSTFLSRITLCMARHSLHKHRRKVDPDPVLSALEPAEIPILVSLKQYAYSYKDMPLSLLDFIKNNIPDQLLSHTYAIAIAPLLEHWLENGLCLVMFDGLDEAANEGDVMRQTVQKEIREFIRRYRHRERRTGNYNRFLITSRIAGYDLDAFLPDRYPNYIIAYLEEQQIADFLPRWCTANVNPKEVGVSKETLQQQADKASERLLQAVRTNVGVKKLAQTPLLLTLMAAMQQKGTELPRSRAELYTKVTETLLDKRNEDKGILPLPVGQAIERLGPLAYLMHEQKYGLANEQQVLDELVTAISTRQGGGGTTENVMAEAQNYLKRFSERGGILVKRTSDFYGFFHRTFEEYFSARYLLYKIKLQGKDEVRRFVTLVRQQNDLWREPYLLAVAYKGQDGGYDDVASQLIRTLFEAHKEDATPNLDISCARLTVLIKAE